MLEMHLNIKESDQTIVGRSIGGGANGAEIAISSTDARTVTLQLMVLTIVRKRRKNMIPGLGTGNRFKTVIRMGEVEYQAVNNNTVHSSKLFIDS